MIAMLGFAALAGAAGVIAYKAKKKKKGGDNCEKIKTLLETKQQALAGAESQLSIQEQIIEALKNKATEKVDEKKDELQEKITEAAKDKLLEAADSKALEKAVDAAERVKETYDDIQDKIEQAQNLYDILTATKGALSKEVQSLESAYNVCVASAPAAQNAEVSEGEITLPDVEREEEQLDILNEKGEKTGGVCSHKKAHEQGVIHRTAHVWVINRAKQLLLQKRAARMRAYANHWSISASGHVSAGESSLDGARRETREELGLDMPESAFQYLFTLEEHIVLNNGTYVNNEFQDVYLVRLSDASSELHESSDEVSSLKWMDLQEFKSWIDGKGELLVPHEEEYSKLLKYLDEHAT